MEVLPLKTPLLKERFNLSEAIFDALKSNNERVQAGDILVVSSKIVALAQGRVVSLKKTTYEDVVRREADHVIPGHGPIPLTLKDGILIPAAGIDRSNAPEDFVILWPKNAWMVARALRTTLCKKFHITRLGIVIADSHCQPLRWGTTGLALSWAGFEGVEDARGVKDLYGTPLKVTKKAVADNCASAALLVMGEAAERIPLALVRGAPVKFTQRKQGPTDVLVKPKDCLFQGLYNSKLQENL